MSYRVYCIIEHAEWTEILGLIRQGLQALLVRSDHFPLGDMDAFRCPELARLFTHQVPPYLRDHRIPLFPSHPPLEYLPWGRLAMVSCILYDWCPFVVLFQNIRHIFYIGL